LLEHQNADGGFSTFNNEEAMKADERFKVPSFSGWCNSHNSVTAIATRALTALGISWHDQRVRNAINFLLTRQQENGLWNDYWWQGPFYTTYLATHVLSSDPIQDQQSHVQRAFDAIAASQFSAGFWTCREDNAPCGFSTALAVKSLLSTNSPQYDEVIFKGIEWLLENQNEQGFWVSPPILQIPRPDVLIPDPIDVNREQEAHFVFTTGTVYSTLLASRDWVCAAKNARVA
jgi:squalene-hopene/tetraprenyl-beta-curcumene cyclase